jgi:hypothetical protein
MKGRWLQKGGEHVRSGEGAYIRRQGTGALTTVASSPSVVVVGYPGKRLRKPSSVGYRKSVRYPGKCMPSLSIAGSS